MQVFSISGFILARDEVLRLQRLERRSSEPSSFAFLSKQSEAEHNYVLALRELKTEIENSLAEIEKQGEIDFQQSLD